MLMRVPVVPAVSVFLFVSMYFAGIAVTDVSITDGWDKFPSYKNRLKFDVDTFNVFCRENLVFRSLVVKTKLVNLSASMTSHNKPSSHRNSGSNRFSLDLPTSGPTSDVRDLSDYTAVLRSYTIFSIPIGHLVITNKGVNCWAPAPRA